MSKSYNISLPLSSTFANFFSSLHPSMNKTQLNFIGDFFSALLSSNSVNFEDIAFSLLSIYPNNQLESLCKRIYPNFVNCDWSGNKEDFNNPDTYMATMGCRTMLGYDRHGFGYSKVGRGNVTPVTINLPKIGIKHGIVTGERTTPDIDGFFNELKELLKLSEKCLVDRFNFIVSQSPLAGPFMYKNNTIRGFDGKDIYSAMKHGTQAIGIIGIAEMCQALFKKNHTDNQVRDFALKVVEYIYNFTKEAGERNDLNFSCYFTPKQFVLGVA